MKPRRPLRIVHLLHAGALAAMLLMTGVSARAQSTEVLDKATAGTRYYIAFPDTASNLLPPGFPNTRVRSEATLLLFSTTAANVHILNNARGSSEVFTLEPYKFTAYTTDLLPVVTTINTVSRKALEVQSTAPIVVYCYLANIQGYEAWTPVPLEQWGVEYRVAANHGEIISDVYTPTSPDVPHKRKGAPAEILVTAAYDGTKVSFVPPPGIVFTGNPSYTVTLNAGESYLLESVVDTNAISQDDISGTVIRATRPIGVISGTTRTMISDDHSLLDNAAKNMMVEAVPSTDLFGTQFVYLPSWDQYRPGIGSSLERAREFARIYATAATGGSYLTNGGGVPVPFNIAKDTLLEVAFGAPLAVAFSTAKPAMAMMHSSSIVHFDGSIPCPSGECTTYSLVAPYMVEMVPREQWSTFAPYYALPNPGGMHHFVSAVTDTVSAKNIYLADGTLFPFTRRIAGTDLIWGTRSVTPGTDGWIEGRSGARFYAVAFGTLLGDEQYRPAGSGTQYEEYNAVSYGYPLAPRRNALFVVDTARIDTALSCPDMTITIQLINASPAGLRSIGFESGTANNARIQFIEPAAGAVDVAGRNRAVVRVSPVDMGLPASGVVLITDRAGKEWRVPYEAMADQATVYPAGPATFGGIRVGDTVVRVFAIRNADVHPVTISRVELAKGKPFSVASVDPPLPATLPPGDSLMIRVACAPTGTQQLYFDTVHAVMGCGVTSIPVDAKLGAPSVYVGDLMFGTNVIGLDGPRTLTLPITNSGIDSLIFTQPPTGPLAPLTWTGSWYTVDPADLERLSRTVLAPGEVVSVRVTFTPPGTPGLYNTVARLWSSTRAERDTSNWRALVVTPASVGDAAAGGYRCEPYRVDGGIAVHYALPVGGRVHLELFDNLGRFVSAVKDADVEAGDHALSIDCRALPSGLYYVRMSSGAFNAARPVVVVR